MKTVNACNNCTACGKEIFNEYPYYKQIDGENIICEICYPEYRFKLLLERRIMEELKPCPFCGDVATVDESYEGEDDLNEIWIVSCNTCLAEMRGRRVEIPTMVKKEDTYGLRKELTDEQIQYLNKSRLDEYGKDEKEALIKAWNKRV